MMTEGRAGFRAFNDGPKDQREVDFIKLRQMLAAGPPVGRRAGARDLAAIRTAAAAAR